MLKRAVRRRPATSRAADKCVRRVSGPRTAVGARWGQEGPCWGRTGRAKPLAFMQGEHAPCIFRRFAYPLSNISTREAVRAELLSLSLKTAL